MAKEIVYKPVTPVRPAAGYIGGKKQLARTIVECIERMPHETYAEPFVGMGGVFRRRRAPKGEIINDRSGDVATFFRIMQRHYVPFMDMLKWQITGRQEFERLKASDPSTLTDLERAARLLYLQRTAFGGKVAGRNFGVDRMGARFNVAKLMPMLEDLHERLAGGVVECLPWADFATIGRRRCSISTRRTMAARKIMVPGCSIARSTRRWRTCCAASKDGSFCRSTTCRRSGRPSKVSSCEPVQLSYTLAGAGNALPARELIILQRR
jgi:DNA adenine methylase